MVTTALFSEFLRHNYFLKKKLRAEKGRGTILDNETKLNHNQWLKYFVAVFLFLEESAGMFPEKHRKTKHCPTEKENRFEVQWRKNPTGFHHRSEKAMRYFVQCLLTAPIVNNKPLKHFSYVVCFFKIPKAMSWAMIYKTESLYLL